MLAWLVIFGEPFSWFGLRRSQTSSASSLPVIKEEENDRQAHHSLEVAIGGLGQRWWQTCCCCCFKDRHDKKGGGNISCWYILCWLFFFRTRLKEKKSLLLERESTVDTLWERLEELLGEQTTCTLQNQQGALNFILSLLFQLLPGIQAWCFLQDTLPSQSPHVNINRKAEQPYRWYCSRIWQTALL